MSDMVRIGANVPKAVADAIQHKADENERSFAAEVRLALRAWAAEPEPEAVDLRKVS